jgi:hypothetical protein
MRAASIGGLPVRWQQLQTRLPFSVRASVVGKTTTIAPASVGVRFLSSTGASSGGSDGEESKDRPGIHKTPVVDHLWTMREQIRRARRDDQKIILPRAANERQGKEATATLASATTSADNPTRSPSDSHTSVIYAFETDAALRAMYVHNPKPLQLTAALALLLVFVSFSCICREYITFSHDSPPNLNCCVGRGFRHS